MGKAAFVLGYVGPKCSSDVRRVWNEFLAEEGSGGMFDFYRTRTIDDLELRLSEMFVLMRRGYVIDRGFDVSIIPLLDELDFSAKESGKVDTVVNRGGRLIGHFFNAQPIERMADRLHLWRPLEATTQYVS